MRHPEIIPTDDHQTGHINRRVTAQINLRQGHWAEGSSVIGLCCRVGYAEAFCGETPVLLRVNVARIPKCDRCRPGRGVCQEVAALLQRLEPGNDRGEPLDHTAGRARVTLLDDPTTAAAWAVQIVLFKDTWPEKRPRSPSRILTSFFSTRARVPRPQPVSSNSVGARRRSASVPASQTETPPARSS